MEIPGPIRAMLEEQSGKSLDLLRPFILPTSQRPKPSFLSHNNQLLKDE